MLRTWLLTCVLAGTSLLAVEPNSLTEEEAAAGFQLLFDGQSLTGWTIRGSDAIPENWIIDAGALHRHGRGGSIASVATFSDFELRLQWKVAEGSNSGIFFRDDCAPNRQHRAHEMQVLDNERHANGKDPLTSAGASYALYAPSEDATRPVGEWNDVRIVARGQQIEYWLNDVNVVSFEIGSEDWLARVAKSKFSKRDGFGLVPDGHIVLQDHGDPVWFRSIRILDLSESPPGKN